MNGPPWLCIQIGPREQYAIPAAMARRGKLAALLTDYWHRPDSLFCRAVAAAKANSQSASRLELQSSPVMHASWGRVVCDLRLQLGRHAGLEAHWRRNRWFQRAGWKMLEDSFRGLRDGGICYAYSYAALGFFRRLKDLGWTCVLNQIDGGPYEEMVMRNEVGRYPELGEFVDVAPPEYWQEWEEECRLADAVVVNSEFSRFCAIQNGISDERLEVIPLAVEAGQRPVSIAKHYPDSFSRERPLRVLYLGALSLRKGIGRLLDAIALLSDEPRLEFVIVGGDPGKLPACYRQLTRVRFQGNVPANKVGQYYDEADIFILPTLSDGFARTQLEALVRRLPVLASRNCGSVVVDGVNGLLLPDVEPATIADAIRSCLEYPARLARMSAASVGLDDHSSDSLESRLLALEERQWLGSKQS